MINKAVFVAVAIMLCTSTIFANAIVDRSQYDGNALRDPYAEVGFKFTTGSSAPTVTALGFIDLNNGASSASNVDPPDGMQSSVVVTLWRESSSSVVAQVTVPSGVASELVDGFRYATISSGPVTLSSNTNYVLSASSGDALDKWLEAGPVTLNSYFVGSNSSSTWEVRWGGSAGAMPTTTAGWGIGMTYGIVNMSSSLPLVAETTAHNPDPVSGALNAGLPSGSVVDVTLSWDAADDPSDPANPDPNIISHELYLKAGNSNFASVTPITIPAGSPVDPRPSYTAAGLGYDQIYYCRVDEVFSSGTVQGPVWSFTTIPDPTSNNVTINTSTTYQVFEGFGEGTLDQFTPYWYGRYSTATLDGFLDKLYTLDDDGLGLEICRFIVPVGDAPSHHHMWGFMYSPNGQGPASFEPEEDIFDWTGHDDIMWRIQGASDRNAKMWANWNSYPYWLTISGCTAGSTDGASNNLSTSNESRFIKHVCDVLAHFRDSWSIDFEYVSVVNECEANWWVAGGGFPGTAVSSNQTISLTSELKTQLNNYSLPGEIIAYDAAFLNYWWYLDNLLTSAIEPDLSVLSVHQYHVSSGGLNAWASRAQTYNKSLWMTEWGDWENDGYGNGDFPHVQAMNYAAKIHESLNGLQANAWIIWETDFLFNTPVSGFVPRESYWTTAQYSRHVRPGMQRIYSSEDNSACYTTAWVDPVNTYPSQTMALVTYNSGSTPVTITYDFSSLSPVEIKEIRQTSQTQGYENISFTQTSTSSFSITVPAESTTTVDATILNCGVFKQADFNDDCAVDTDDLLQLVAQWLCDLPCEQLDTDLTGDCQVTSPDFAKLSNDWD